MPRVPVVPTQQLNPQGPAQYSAPGVVPVQDQSPRQAMAMGEAFQQAGRQWGAYAADIQRRQDIAETEEQFNKVAEDDNNEFAKFGALEGKAAVDAFEAFDQSQQQRYRVALERAKNETQRQWLKEKLGDRRVQIIGRARAHKEDQLAVQRYGVAQQSTKQAVADAVTFADGPDRDDYFAKVVDRATEQAQLAGVDPEPVAKLAMQDAHLGYLDKLLKSGRTGEAVRYWADNGDKVVDAEERDKWGRIVRGTYLQEQTVALGNSVVEEKPATGDDAARGPIVRPRTLDEQFAVVDQIAASGVITGAESQAAKNTLLEMANDRDRVQASRNKALRNEADEWYRVHPLGEIESDPVMAEKFRAANMPIPERVRINDPEFDRFLQSMPAGTVARVQRMSEDQLDEFLATGVAGGQRYGNGLDKQRAERWKAFFQGDRTKAAREDAIEQAALLLGISASPTARAEMDREERAANTEMYGRFRAQVANQIETLRVKLKGDPTLQQIQEEILDPMMRDKISHGGVEKPVVAFQALGLLPYDDPMTRDVDESMDMSKAAAAGEFAVMTSKGPINLREVPIEVRREIRLTWARQYPGRQMTVREEMDEYAKNYKPTLDQKRAAEEAARRPTPMPESGTRVVPGGSQMRDSFSPWGR